MGNINNSVGQLISDVDTKNQSITLPPRENVGNYIGKHVAGRILYAVATPIVITCSLVANVARVTFKLIEGVFAAVNHASLSLVKNTLKNRVTAINSKDYPLTRVDTSKKNAMEDIVKLIEAQISANDRKVDEISKSLKTSAKGIAACIVAAVTYPFFVLGGVNVSSAKADPASDKYSKPGAKLAELTAGSICPAAMQMQLFPYRGKTREELLKQYAHWGENAYLATTITAGVTYEAKFMEQSVENGVIKEVEKSGKRHAKTLPHTKKAIEVDRGDDKKHQILCHQISAKGIPGEVETFDPKKRTMVLFHGNGMVGEDMRDEAEFYRNEGCNVFVVTMGGYPGSDEGLDTNEITTIQDVNAVLQYLDKKMGVKDIGVHGHSIGGTMATTALTLRPDLVKVCVLSKTFTSAADVCANVVKNALGPLASVIPGAVTRGLVNAGFPSGINVYGVKAFDGKPYVTDGMNNEKRLQTFKGRLLTIGGSADPLMGSGKRVTKSSTKDTPDNVSYVRNFADPLANAPLISKEGGDAKAIMEEAGHSSGIADDVGKAIKEHILRKRRRR